MPQESPTRLIERETLADLVESTRVKQLAHTVRRAGNAATIREPSAVRGLVFVVLFALVARVAFRWLFY